MTVDETVVKSSLELASSEISKLGLQPMKWHRFYFNPRFWSRPDCYLSCSTLAACPLVNESMRTVHRPMRTLWYETRFAEDSLVFLLDSQPWLLVPNHLGNDTFLIGLKCIIGEQVVYLIAGRVNSMRIVEPWFSRAVTTFDDSDPAC